MSWKLLTLLVQLFCLQAATAFTARGLVYPGQNEFFELSIVHLNDFHARFVEASYGNSGGNYLGGLGRLLTATRELLQQRPNPIFLNAGDHFQGTLWYNLHKWNATVHFMNKLPHDVMTIGNHDFDDGIDGLLPFLQRVHAPVVVTNIDDSEEPTIQGYYKNSTIIVRGKHTIGVIGVIIKTTNTLANTGKLRFLDEVESINAEAERLRDKGVNMIIVLSHAGLDIDRTIAAKCPQVDVIVGGHSHSFLYSGKPPFIDEPEDEYPVVVQQHTTNRTVLIVQAAAYTKYLGNLTVWFDNKGEVADWEGNPILLDDSIAQDPEMMEELKPWAKAVEAMGNAVVGETQNFLNSSCRSGECNLANLITDAMVYSYQNASAKDPNHWAYAAISCMNSGGIRNSIPIGEISYGDVVTVQPFENTWDVVELKGQDLYTVLEESVARSYNEEHFVGVSFLHWSGIKVVYNMSKPAGSRVKQLSVRCQACRVPKYEALDRNYWYRLVVPSFLLTEGNDASTIARKHRNHKRGPVDIGLLVSYLKAISPFSYELDFRVQLQGHFNPASNPSF